VTSGELGKVKKFVAHIDAPAGTVGPTDIRFQFALGGGAGMDVGCYITSVSRFIAGREPTEVLQAEATLLDKEREPKIGRRFEFTYAFPPGEGENEGVTAECMGDLAAPWTGLFGFLSSLPVITVTVYCEKGEATLFNFVLPTFYHYISDRGPKGSWTEEAYTWDKEGKATGWKGEAYWSTYRFQLETFVDKLQGRVPQYWVTGENTVANMRCIEMVL